MIIRYKEKVLSEKSLAVARFLLSGILNTAITYFIFLSTSPLFGVSLAYTVTYAVGILIAYLLNTVFVFKTGHSKRMAVAVPVTYAIQYLYGMVALGVLIHVFHLPAYGAMAMVILSSFPLQFLILQFVANRACR